MIMGCNASGTSAPMLARSLLSSQRMDVGLLTNALVSNVGVVSGLSESAAPISARSPDLRPTEQFTTANEAQGLTPDNTPIDAASQSSHDEPAKDFGQTLQERIQAQGSETVECAVKTEVPSEAAATPNQSPPDQSQLVSTEASAGPSAALDETVQEAANVPQQELVVESSQDLAQLLTNSGLSKSVNLTAGRCDQTSVMPTSTVSESPDKLCEQTVEQSQIEPKAAQSAQYNAAPVLDAQSAKGEQIDPKTAQNDSLTPQQGTAVEEKGPLLSESIADGCKQAVPVEKSGDAVEQTITKTGPGLRDNPDVTEEKSSDGQPGQGEHGPKISASAFGEADGKAGADRPTRAPSELHDGSGTEAGGPGEKTLSGDSITQKLNPAQVESAADQAKGRNTAASSKSSRLEINEIIPADSPRISAAEQPLAAAQTPKSAANPSDSGISSTVSEQIRESITSSTVGPNREITIRLNPPELGSVVVKFQEQGDHITGLLEVSKSQTRAEIQQMLPEITRDLQELGVQVKRLEVVMTGEQERQTLNGQSEMPQQNGWGGQQSETSPDPHAPYASADELPADKSDYNGFTGRNQIYVTDGSIDMFA